MDNDSRFRLIKIGELAALAGVSVKALRIYEKKNIIKPVEVDLVNGYRYYSAGQLEQVESLLELQDMGFSLNEIERILSGKCSQEEMTELIEKREKILKELIWKTEAKLEEIEVLKKNMKNSRNGRKIEDMTDEERAWHLAKLVRVNENNVKQAISEAIWL